VVRALAIVLGTLGLMLASAWIMRNEPSVARRNETREASALPQPGEARELLQLRAEVRALRGEVAAAKGLAAVRAAETDRDSEPAVEPVSPFDAEHAATTRAKALSSRFEAETLDGAWSSEAVGGIHRVFDGGAVAGTRLVAAECHRTLCRVQLRHDDETARDELAQQIAEKTPFAAGVYYVPSPDDARETTLYVVRGGK
jgi:hypothetical protein